MRILRLLLFITFAISLTMCGSDGENPVTDFAAEVTVAATDAIAKEGDNDASFTISLSEQNTSGAAINIPFSLEGTATEGDDYTAINRIATIDNGQTTAEISVEVIDDTEEEKNETVRLILGVLPEGISAGSVSSASVTIEDNDAVTTTSYSLSVAGTTSVNEGAAEAVFTVTLDKSNDTGAPITVNYALTGTATEGVDYSTPSGSATIDSDASEANISIPLINDTDEESDETIILTLSSDNLPSNVSIGTGTLTITIMDNDAASTGTDVAITFGNIEGNSVEISSWTDIGADNYIIIMNSEDAFTDLANTDDPDFSPTYNGEGEQVVYNGAAISAFSITLLETSTTYYFKVFPATSGTVDNSQSSQSRSTVTCSTSGTTSNEVCFEIASDLRTITSNQYPDHATGTFPNADVTAIVNSKTVDFTPSASGSITYVYDETSGPGPTNKKFFEFGVASNGIGYDPMGLKPWTNPDTGEENWAWQAKVVDQGETHLDAYGGHVNSTGKYHYHGDVIGLADDEDGSRHSRIYGFAADGFPIYYKYGYSDPNDPASAIVELQSSYQLKSGSRPGDGTTAPSGTYDGTYIQDYEYVSSLGDLDECNGRTGVTPEYPDGTYYYVVTSEFPKLPNCFKGTPNGGFIIK